MNIHIQIHIRIYIHRYTASVHYTETNVKMKSKLCLHGLLNWPPMTIKTIWCTVSLIEVSNSKFLIMLLGRDVSQIVADEVTIIPT